ncbi:MAG TPA: M14 family zinc carboxypeptidase, partial [Gemmatimonadaceae bacterium]
MRRVPFIAGLALINLAAPTLLAQRGGGGGRGGGEGGQAGPNRNVLVVPGERHGTSVFALTNYPEVKPLVPGQIDWQHYHTSAEIEEFMHKWAQQYPDLVDLYVVGKSFGGRDIWQMTLTNKKTGAHTDKPAAFFEGGRHSGEISSTESVF